jgi:hypothetical protein
MAESNDNSISGSGPQFTAGNRSVIFTENADADYAGMLVFLVKRHLERVKTLRQFNRLIEIGTLAWNLALTLQVDPENFEAVRDDHVFNLDIDDEQLAVIEEMIEEKNGLFSGFEKFIIAALVTNGPDDSYEVMVKTGEYDDFDFVPDEED